MSTSTSSAVARKHAAGADDTREFGDAKRQKPNDAAAAAADPLSIITIRIAVLAERLAQVNQALAELQQAAAASMAPVEMQVAASSMITKRALSVSVIDVDPDGGFEWPVWFCEEPAELAKEFNAIWGTVSCVECNDEDKNLRNLAPLLHWQTPKRDTAKSDFEWPMDRAERMAALRAHIDAGKEVYIPALPRDSYDTQGPDASTPYLLWHVYLRMM